MQEFIEFQSRLENSLQKMIADRELIRLEFLKEDSVSRAIAWLQELEIVNLKYDGTVFYPFIFSLSSSFDHYILLTGYSYPSPYIIFA